MKVDCFKVIPIVFFLCTLLFSPAYSTTYYVDQNNASASDSNMGTSEELPWLTLEKSMTVVVAGDTVIVKAGTYQDSNANSVHPYPAFRPANSGTNGNPITFRSEPVLAAIIKPKNWTGTESTGYMAWGLESRSYITIDGFRIIGGFRAHDCRYITIKNCELTEGFYPPVDTTLNWGIALENSSYCTVQNNYVHNLLNPSDYYFHNEALFMLFGSDHCTVEYNTGDAGGYIYSIYGQKAGRVHDNIWRYNFGMNSHTGFTGMGSTDGSEYSEDNAYYQNIIYNVFQAFDLDHNSRNFDIHNNSFYQIGKFIRAGSEGGNSGLTIYNNLISKIYHTESGTKAIYADDVDEVPSSLITYDDYNRYDYTNNDFYRKHWSTYATDLSDYQSLTTFGNNSIEGGVSYVNAGGTTPEDYKLSSYLTDGRGGSYASVMGAYLTGNETIGYSSSAVILVPPPNVKLED